MKNKKIGIFSFDFYPTFGGIGTNLYKIYKRIYNLNSFLVFSPNNNDFKNHKQIFGNLKNSGNTLLFSYNLNKNINKIIKEHNLSIVHFHCGPGGLIITKKPDAKMICTVHHTYYQQQKHIPSQKWKYIFYLFEKKMYKNADKIICVSEDTKNVLINYYNISKEKITVIPNGVDLGKFKKLKNMKKMLNSLLFVGRLDKRKGIDFLVNSISLVKKEIPNIKLNIIGKGKFRKKLEKYILKNNLQENIQFLGFVPDEDLPKWYNQSQLTIVPSVFEGFGITIIESLASGTPVIGTYTDGIRTIIKDKKFLVKYGDKKALSKKIIEFIRKSPKINFDRKQYSWDEIAKNTLEVYK